MQLISKQRISLFILFVLLVIPTSFVFARGGGGGSSGGGGGSSSHSGSSGSSQPQYQHGSCSSSTFNQTEEECLYNQKVTVTTIITLIIFGAIFTLFSYYLNYKKRKETQEPVLSQKTEEIYYQFQKAWSDFDVATLQKITSTRFYNQLVFIINSF